MLVLLGGALTQVENPNRHVIIGFHIVGEGANELIQVPTTYTVLVSTFWFACRTGVMT